MDDRANILRGMRICRFCLNEDEPLTNIYEKDSKQSVPLPIQIMACFAIEVFANDGMPQLICKSCRYITQQAYNFKATCKQSDDALKLFIATGSLSKPQIKHIALSGNETTEKSVANKRILQEQSRAASQKKKRTASSEYVTLNYSNRTDTADNLQEHSPEKRDPESSQEYFGIDDDVERFEEIVEQNASQQDLDEEDDDNINPVLKVPQVETDVFPCPHCERSFPLKQLLEIHSKNHERERSFGCDECGRKFFTKYDLGKHIQTHSNLKPFVCVVCQKHFSRESLLHRHEKIHIDVPKYLCTICDRTFLTRDDLDAHSEKHKKKRPFACRLCNKSFVFKQGLERHELTHADQKPHKCNYCEASFTSPIKLTRHVTSHAGLRPYPCKLCGRTFLLSHHLTRHMRSHYAAKSSVLSPIGQHKCDVCSMSFKRKDSLINHSAIHSMVNLKCVICNTAFENAKMVKEHITTHLSGLPYVCDRCDYSFETQDQLEEHELKHAEMEYEEQIEKEVCMEQQQDVEDEEDEEDYNSAEDDIAEFTITNPENPELIRRSKRTPKIKNYAQFLKDELGSDLEDEATIHDSSDEHTEEETIKPVVRLEGTKVYGRKNMPEKPKLLPVIKPENINATQLEQITEPQLTTLENLGLTKQAVGPLSNKKFVDMKIGDKTVRVQKLIMTKAEIEAMAREGKIEMKGNTLLLKHTKSMPSKAANIPKSSVKSSNLDSILENLNTESSLKPMVKRTYVRKVPTAPKEGNATAAAATSPNVENVSNEETADEQDKSRANNENKPEESSNESNV